MRHLGFYSVRIKFGDHIPSTIGDSGGPRSIKVNVGATLTLQELKTLLEIQLLGIHQAESKHLYWIHSLGTRFMVWVVLFSGAKTQYSNIHQACCNYLPDLIITITISQNLVMFSN